MHFMTTYYDYIYLHTTFVYYDDYILLRYNYRLAKVNSSASFSNFLTRWRRIRHFSMRPWEKEENIDLDKIRYYANERLCDHEPKLAGYLKKTIVKVSLSVCLSVCTLYCTYLRTCMYIVQFCGLSFSRTQKKNSITPMTNNIWNFFAPTLLLTGSSTFFIQSSRLKQTHCMWQLPSWNIKKSWWPCDLWLQI